MVCAPSEIQTRCLTIQTRSTNPWGNLLDAQGPTERNMGKAPKSWNSERQLSWNNGRRSHTWQVYFVCSRHGNLFPWRHTLGWRRLCYAHDLEIQQTCNTGWLSWKSLAKNSSPILWHRTDCSKRPTVKTEHAGCRTKLRPKRNTMWNEIYQVETRHDDR